MLLFRVICDEIYHVQLCIRYSHVLCHGNLCILVQCFSSLGYQIQYGHIRICFVGRELFDRWMVLYKLGCRRIRRVHNNERGQTALNLFYIFLIWILIFVMRYYPMRGLKLYRDECQMVERG